MKVDNGALSRAVVYSFALGYLLLDLLVMRGPLYRKIQGIGSTGERAIKGEVARGVAARVYRQPILLTQIDRAVEERLWKQGRSVEGLGEGQLKEHRYAALNGLFDQHLLRIKVRYNAKEVKVTEGEVAAAVQRFKRKFVNEEILKQARENQGWQGEEELIARVRAKLEQEAYLANRIRLEISERELQSFYDEHRNRFGLPERIRVRHLFFAALDHPDGEARQLASRVKGRLDRGENFIKLARELSEDSASRDQGGDLGWMERRRLPRDFAEQVFALPVGEVRLVETLLGAHLVEVLGKREKRARAFEEVKEELRVALSNQRREEGLRQYLYNLRKREGDNLEVFHEVLALPWSFSNESD